MITQVSTNSAALPVFLFFFLNWSQNQRYFIDPQGEIASNMPSVLFDQSDNLMQDFGYSPSLKNTLKADFQKIKIDKEKMKKVSTVWSSSAHTRERSCFCVSHENPLPQITTSAHDAFYFLFQ